MVITPILLLRDIHSNLHTHYDKEDCDPSQSQVHVGSLGGHSSQDPFSSRFFFQFFDLDK